jgi:hypothetical protein
MSDLVEIVAQHTGVTPKRIGKTYHFPCPACSEGSDRFIVWPATSDKPTGTFYCRQCRIAGDGIEFCKRFLGCSYSEACELFRVEKKRLMPSTWSSSPPKLSFPQAKFPASQWQERGSHHLLLWNAEMIERQEAGVLLHKRGIKIETAKAFSLGYNPTTEWESMEKWGLPKAVKENGRERKVWLPKGLAIPRYDPVSRSLLGIKVRRDDWKKGDDLPKYVEIVGSSNVVGIFGDITRKIAVVLESELDAIVVQQEAGDLCFSLSLGGAGTKRMDKFTQSLLSQCSLVLLATDYDSAGLNEIHWWKEHLPAAEYWPAPCGKSPGDAFEQGADLHLWLLCAIRKYQIKGVL